jgi:HrpA-like RNA helicase
MASLPIAQVKSQIIQEFQESHLVLVGATGSGKTTQLPQYLLPHTAGIIAITQPRKVAAITIAKRVAQEMNVKVGDLVGYSVRFQDKTSPRTRIKYMTDGMLLRELLTDPLLKKYSLIILDEAHERTIRTDILFGAIKKILPKRNLKVVVMSATLNASMFAYFFKAKIFEIPGRQFPVQILYAQKVQNDYCEAAISSIFQIHQKQNPGDILVFLTGQEEIENLTELIEDRCKELDCQPLLVCPIFASLPTSQQQKVFDPAPKGIRKVILATNIAETSITISGIRYVVDTGVAKVKYYNAKTGIESLSVKPISKASADQRAGRAGREAAGICYRLFPESLYQKLADETEPEIKR